MDKFKSLIDGMEFKFKVTDRVRLKPSRSDVYPLAFGGSEAVIKAQKLDPVGKFPLIYVEWDKKHWTYNGQPDMWTFEDHFETAEKEGKVPEEDFIQELSNLLSRYTGKGKEPAPTEESEENNQSSGEIWEEAGIEAANSCAYMVITIREGTKPNMMVPSVYTYFDDDRSRLLLGVQLSQAAADLHLFDVFEFLDQGSDDNKKS